MLHSSPYPEAREALDKAIACSYWASSQDRIKSQWALWQEEFTADMLRWNGPKKSSERCGTILPQVVPAGTVTRRAVERTWLTGKVSARTQSHLHKLISSFQSKGKANWIRVKSHGLSLLLLIHRIYMPSRFVLRLGTKLSVPMLIAKSFGLQLVSATDAAR